MCPGNAGASDFLARPPLPAASQWPSLAWSTGNLAALLAGHDGGDDAALQYAHGPTSGVCWSQTRTFCCGSPCVPGWLCSNLDDICARGSSGRHAGASSGGTMAVVSSSFLAHWRGDVLHRRSVPVQPPQGALLGHVPHPTGFLYAPLPKGSGYGVAAGFTPWRILPGLLLGLDARHVRGRRGKSGRDGCAHWRHGDRKGGARRQAAKPRYRGAATATPELLAITIKP